MHPRLAAVRRCASLVVLALLLLGLTASFASAQPAEVVAPHLAQADDADDADGGADGDGEVARDLRMIEILPLRGGFIDPPVVAQIEDVFDAAHASDAELLVLQYSSGGGVSVDLDRALGLFETSEVPVAVLVGPLWNRAEAAGAAGLMWLAADVRAIAADATVGPLEPADLAVGDDPALRSLVHDLVAAAGGDQAITERLLTEAVPADDLAEAGLVSLTATGLEPLLVELDGTSVTTAAGERELRIRSDEVEVRLHSLGLLRRLLHAATTGPFIYLLLVVGLGMLLFEVFQPGFGVAGLAGIITAAIGAFGLFVLPVVWWGVALVVLGLLLYAIDTAMAGFGFVTLAATAAFVVGSLNFYAADALSLPVWLVIGTAITTFAFFVFVMTSILRAQAGPEGISVEQLVGRPGIVRSVLNPEGHVYIDGALWRARWTGESKRAKVGTPVRVHGIDGPVVLVDAFDPEAIAAGGSSREATVPDGVIDERSS